MKKPKSMWEFCEKLFLPMGLLFLLFYLLAQAGVMKMKTGSRGNSSIFLAVGCIFLAAAIFFLLLVAFTDKRKKQLLQTGIQVTGTVTSVEQLAYTRWNASCPYVVRFAYEWEGRQYEGASGLLWELPSVKEHDSLAVFLDDKAPKHFAVKL